MVNEENKIKETSATQWHPNAPLNPSMGAEQTETDFNASQDRPQAEVPVSRPHKKGEIPVVPPIIAESDDAIEHQWRAGIDAETKPH